MLSTSMAPALPADTIASPDSSMLERSLALSTAFFAVAVQTPFLHLTFCVVPSVMTKVARDAVVAPARATTGGKNHPKNSSTSHGHLALAPVHWRKNDYRRIRCPVSQICGRRALFNRKSHERVSHDRGPRPHQISGMTAQVRRRLASNSAPNFSPKRDLFDMDAPGIGDGDRNRRGPRAISSCRRRGRSPRTARCRRRRRDAARGDKARASPGAWPSRSCTVVRKCAPSVRIDHT